MSPDKKEKKKKKKMMMMMMMIVPRPGDGNRKIHRAKDEPQWQ